MHPMIAVEVPIIADRLKEDILNRLRTHQQKSRARSRHEVLNTQDCKLPGKPMQCVEDNMTMSDMSSSSTHSDDTDNDYHASSEENDSMKPSSKYHRLPTSSFNAVSHHSQFQIPRAAAVAGHENVKQKDSKM
ncbi:hypothetical protein I7I48_05382 [Histoplasma ohiense]|nr:hypothetical protein I7I48_05382 [Histoplasma ohiense (nom. inval.)]